MPVSHSFRDKVQELVSEFESNKSHFLSAHYPESQVRIDFINKLFEVLGWSISLKPGENPYERDVIVERGQTKGRPDYNFRLNGETRFFVEAKAPHAGISKNDVLQTKKYAWNNTDQIVYFAAVTDFQEFRFYDASRKPDPKHPEVGLIFSYTYDKYPSQKALADLWLLSRESIVSGTLDKLISPSVRAARTKTPLDQEFLNDLTYWRGRLAKSVYKAHPDFSPTDLNSVIQVFLDRLIFIRIAEDRGALPPNRLREIERVWRDEGKERPITAELLPLFREINIDLNGEIFKPHKCEEVKWESGLLAEIIEEGLEPYNFAQIGVELLGSIYERYLGKTIRVTASRAIVEEKPEVRKAGGVYYTPKYVANYIVSNTVGRLIKGKTPTQIAKIRILDPACGSGSFLLNAYQYILDYHLDWYKRHSQKKALGQLTLLEGEWKLSIREKARILKNNIYGVDIDPQAVEITMMSLYIKLLEGEKSLPQKSALLPTLSPNIRCGNSLIRPGIGDKELFKDNDRVYEIRPFDWWSKREGFGEILSGGGFEVVIGNPPYVRPHNIPADIKKILWATFTTFVAKSDIYSCFMERGLELTKPGGAFSFIVPQTWTSLESFTKIRKFILDHAKVIKLVQLPKKVFADSTVETCIFVFERTRSKPKQKQEVQIEKLDPNGKVENVRAFSQRKIEETHLFNFQLHGREDSQAIIRKIKKAGTPLEEYVKFVYGFKTADDEKFIHSVKKHKESKPFIRSAGIHRYWYDNPEEYVWYVPELMVKNRRTARPGEAERFESEKLMVSRMGKELIATYDFGGLYVKDAMLLLSKSQISLKYLLGVLNSRLLNYYYQEFFVTIDVLKNALLSLPIRVIDPNNAEDKFHHDEMVKLVDEMLFLQSNRQKMKSSTKIAQIDKRINLLDEQIDELVSLLYGLKEEEKGLIDSNVFN